jgi:WD40-like Beta Propeller Repeat
MRTSAKQALREFRAPDETGAEDRAWTTVRSAYLEREPVAVHRRRVRPAIRLATAPIAALLMAGLLLSPAGASVRRLITHALGERRASPALSSLPSPGRILVSGAGGTWSVAADGSTRHVGAWRQASWSPHGLFLAVSSGDRLAAVDPRGEVHWAIDRPSISDPRWFSPSGYRVAYLSAGTLRVIAGDGTGDHLLANAVAGVAPAWRPGHPYELAYVTDRGSIVVRDADTGRLLWSTPPGPQVRGLIWSSDGRRLFVVCGHAGRIYTGGGSLRAWLDWPGHTSAGDAALSPDGRTLAVVTDHDQVVALSTDVRTPATRQLLTGAGLGDVSWSPDGRWLLVSWPAADQWVFLRVAGPPHVTAVSRIKQQFSSAGAAARGFPQLDGWCCTATGQAG